MASFSQQSTRYVSSVESSQSINTQEEVIDFYLSGISMKRISELSNGSFTEWQVYKILDSNDIKRRSFGNTGIIYDSFFETIDTPEKAYLLGMIQADGNVRKHDSPQVAITQHNNYAWYLRLMVNEFIRPNAIANKDKNCKQITFTSPKLHADLISKGIIPNKSYDQTEEHIDLLWNSLPVDMIPSFLRGFLDGDGSIRFFKQNNKGKTESCNISWNGNKFLLHRIKEWMFVTLGYTAMVNLISGKDNLWRISVTKPDIGDKLLLLMLKHFVYPYGHPSKTSRMIERINKNFPIANYGDKCFEVILPCWLNNDPLGTFLWLMVMDSSERTYSLLIKQGWSPQQARTVLPHSLKTEIVMTANFREWRLIFEQRALGLTGKPHPQMAQIMIPLIMFYREWFYYYTGAYSLITFPFCIILDL